MGTYIIGRTIESIVVLVFVSIIVFFAMRLMPGDPILMLISSDEMSQITDEAVAELRHEFGLDRPMIVQYFDWLLSIFRGDLGVSIISRVSVSKLIIQRFPITLHLGILAFAIGTVLGIFMGVLSAIRRGKWLDTVMTLSANLGVTVPIFWLGIMMIFFFSIYLGLLPVYGYISPFVDFWRSTKHIIMPVICLSVFPMAATARQTRSSMLEVMNQDYIRTAISKGITERRLVMVHALKNSLIPVITLLGVGIRNLIGGSIIVETVFNITGMGRLAVQGVLSKDYAIVQGVVLVIVVGVVLVNLLVDISYSWLDPRIRYE